MSLSSVPPPHDDAAWQWLRGESARAIDARMSTPRWRGFDLSAMVGGGVMLVTGLARGQAWISVLGLVLLTFGLMLFAIRVAQRYAAQNGLGDALRSWLESRDRFLGDAETARERSEGLLALAPQGSTKWFLANEAVNVLINGGCYREALAVPERWSTEARAAGMHEAPTEFGLVEINLAEAEYNLGLVEAADARMQRLAAMLEDPTGPLAPGKVGPIVLNGMRVQRAWIAGLRNEPERGFAYLDGVDESALPPRFHAEVDYTRAFLLLKARRFPEAMKAAEAGFDRALRPSSERNGLFLVGQIFAELGALQSADRAFERGAAHAYRGQGGEALVCWAQVLTRMRRPEDAKRALEQCVERDPQSPAAQTAASLLGQVTE